jgi:hypothetical protein
MCKNQENQTEDITKAIKNIRVEAVLASPNRGATSSVPASRDDATRFKGLK